MRSRAAHRPRLAQRLQTTRRGAFLLLIGTIYAFLGVVYALPVPETSLEPYMLAIDIVPAMPFWGGLWALSGLIGMVTAWSRDGRDVIGFMSLAGWSSVWGTLALGSTVLEGSQRGWIAGLIWITFGLAVLIVNGMERSRPGSGSAG